jgi:hypothetical protein
MLDEWHQLKLLNVMSEEDITKIMASQLYQEASYDIKLQWWIQVSKSFTVGTWVDGKKVTKPSSAAEIVFRYCEGNQVTI